VFVLAGVPKVMQGMLEDIGWRLRGGAVMVSRTVRVQGSGEGVIAEPLERVAKAYPSLSMGSYPFYGPSGYGANLVIRGRDPELVDEAATELIDALGEAAIEGVLESQG